MSPYYRKLWHPSDGIIPKVLTGRLFSPSNTCQITFGLPKHKPERQQPNQPDSPAGKVSYQETFNRSENRSFLTKLWSDRHVWSSRFHRQKRLPRSLWRDTEMFSVKHRQVTLRMSRVWGMPGFGWTCCEASTRGCAGVIVW